MKTNRYVPTLFVCALLAAATIIVFNSMPVRASEMDERIESAANNSYMFRTYLKNDSIHTESKNGIVTLIGTVSEENHKSLAQETVASLPGVQSVDNQLQVREKTPDKDTDTWLSVKVKTALLFHRSVNVVETQVYVKDGVVTLRGEADSQAQKDLTTEYAKDVEGVKGVRNEMTMAKNPNKSNESIKEMVDDASITAQVKMALLWHRSTSAISTKVETKNGVVTVTGKAKNDAEKDLVTKLVRDVNGVKNVVNNMSTE